MGKSKENKMRKYKKVDETGQRGSSKRIYKQTQHSQRGGEIHYQRDHLGFSLFENRKPLVTLMYTVM